MCSLHGEETATIWNVSHPKARIEHRCDCCGGAIPAGERYALTNALNDGHWSNAKSCFGCATIINEFGEEHRFYPWPGTFPEYLTECASWDEESARHWAPAVAFLKQRMGEEGFQ